MQEAGRTWSLFWILSLAFFHFAFSFQMAGDSNFSKQRNDMVESQLRDRGIQNPAVLNAMSKVPRHQFVPENQSRLAYSDFPLPIGYGQTISQPYIVAYMTEALQLKPHEKVLEIGTGSGYQAAVLAEIAAEVYSIELIPELAERARQTLEKFGYINVHVKAGDGYKGWPEQAPFDAIIVTAAPDTIPEVLVEQLKMGGRMIVPVGAFFQELMLLKKSDEGIQKETLIPVRFVPMIKGDEER